MLFDKLSLYHLRFTQGTSDNTVPYKHAGVMHRIVPRSELITIDGGGHDLTISHPDTINNALLRFFEKKTQ
jgi:pimeloyl-ACP methyl ester carboxylesterase